MKHHPDDLVLLFNDLFRESCRTILVAGGEEPEYIPATGADDPHQIIFAHDYFASALHEVSHWCIAGASRRALRDYGYWYCPDGRDVQQQALFERVEISPQALEWIFSEAAGSRFRISLDNLSGGGSDESRFRRNVATQVTRYLACGLPERARQFADALMAFYERPQALRPDRFEIQERSPLKGQSL